MQDVEVNQSDLAWVYIQTTSSNHFLRTSAQSSTPKAQWEMVEGVIKIPMVDWKEFEALFESLGRQFTFSLHRCPITLGVPEAQGICYFSA